MKMKTTITKIILIVLLLVLEYSKASSYINLNDAIDVVHNFKNEIPEYVRRNLVASFIDLSNQIRRNYSEPLLVALDENVHITHNVDVSMHVEVVFQEVREVILERGARLDAETEYGLVRRINDFLSEKRKVRKITNITLPPVHILSPVVTKRYPRKERVYIEMKQSRTTERITCIHFDRGSEPIECKRLPQSGPMFFSEYAPSGPHVLQLYGKQNHDTKSKGTLLSTSHFYISEPQISIVATRFSSNIAILEISLFEFCNQKDGDGDLNVLMDGHMVTFPPFDHTCSMLPQEIQSSCFVLQNIQPGPHVLRALLVTNNSRAVGSSPAFILPDEINPQASTPEGGCVTITFPQQQPEQRNKETMLKHLRLLPQHEWGVHSQNGEDGILMWLLRTIRPNFRCSYDTDGVRTPSPPSGAANFYVEFGVENGFECNTRFLREACGWTGLQMDGGYSNSDINLHQHFIDAETINELFEMHKVPPNLSILSIDIDYNDIWIWLAIDEKYRPEIVVMEYNSHIKPSESRVIPYNATRMWDGFTAYFGVGIGALAKVAKQKGYTIVHCDGHGVNCFLIRNDLIGAFDLTLESGFSTEDVFVAPNFYNKGWEYPFPNGKDAWEDWVWL